MLDRSVQEALESAGYANPIGKGRSVIESDGGKVFIKFGTGGDENADVNYLDYEYRGLEHMRKA